MSSGNVSSADGATRGAFHRLGFIGALVSFIASATSFWDGAWGVFQAIVWPALPVYEALDKLRA